MPQTPCIPLLTRPFYFVRHGETVSNLSGTIAGSADVPLTARGRLQAQAAAAQLTSAGVTAIYSSALARARDTADFMRTHSICQSPLSPSLRSAIGVNSKAFRVHRACAALRPGAPRSITSSCNAYCAGSRK